MTTQPDNKPVVDVSIGILHREDGRILMARRAEGKPSAGRWEFPGGKIEATENPHAALVRELQEELGIDTISAHPWMMKQHSYSALIARLHIFRVTGWHGEPHGREGQLLSWQNPNEVDVAPLLAVNHGIIADFLSTVWPET